MEEWWAVESKFYLHDKQHLKKLAPFFPFLCLKEEKVKKY